MVGLMTIYSITVRGGSVTHSMMARATSSGSIIVARAAASGLSGRLSRIGVSTSAGMMSVARMPWLRSVLWTCCMRLRTAALAAPYGAPPIKPALGPHQPGRDFADAGAGSRDDRDLSLENTHLSSLGAPKWPPNPLTFGAPRRSRGAPLFPRPHRLLEVIHAGGAAVDHHLAKLV